MLTLGSVISHLGGTGLTVSYSDFAFPVLGTEDGLIEAALLDDGANGALAVRAVVGRVLTQLQSSLIGYKNREQSLNHTLSGSVTAASIEMFTTPSPRENDASRNCECMWKELQLYDLVQREYSQPHLWSSTPAQDPCRRTCTSR